MVVQKEEERRQTPVQLSNTDTHTNTVRVEKTGGVYR